MQGRTLIVLSLVLGLVGGALGLYSFNQQRTLTRKVVAAGQRVDTLQSAIEDVYKVDLDVLMSAVKEGEFTWYTATPQLESQELAKRFMARYPFIKVNVFRLTGGPLSERLMADHQRGQIVASAITHSEPSEIMRWGSQGLVEKFVPAAAESFPASMRQFEPFGYPDRLVNIGLTYNVNKVAPAEEEILKKEGWEALANPVFKDRIVLVDPALAGSAFNQFYIMKQAWGAEKYLNWARRVKANNPIFFNSNVPASATIASGEKSVAAVIELFGIQQVELNAPVKMLWPEPIPAYFGLTSLVAKAPSPNAAKLFIEWFEGVEGQTAWMEIYRGGSAHPNVPDTRAHTRQAWFQKMDPKPTVERFTFVKDLDKQAADRQAFLAEFDSIFAKR